MNEQHKQNLDACIAARNYWISYFRTTGLICACSPTNAELANAINSMTGIASDCKMGKSRSRRILIDAWRKADRSLLPAGKTYGPVRMRTDLNVPYAEKDEAKRLGAKWDGIKRTWYVLNIEDLRPFMRWMPDHLTRPHDPNKKHRKSRVARQELKHRRIDPVTVGRVIGSQTGPNYRPMDHGDTAPWE